MLDADRVLVLVLVVDVGMVDLAARVGLGSWCWLLFRNLVPVAVPNVAAFAAPVRNAGRVGEVSRDVNGEAVSEEAADCCGALDAWFADLMTSAAVVDEIRESRFGRGFEDVRLLWLFLVLLLVLIPVSLLAPSALPLAAAAAGCPSILGGGRELCRRTNVCVADVRRGRQGFRSRWS